MHFWAILQALTILATANGTPVVAKKLLGRRFAQPLDGGLVLGDGRPLFGASKTYRGLILSILMSALAAPLIDLRPSTGAMMGAAAMLGDLSSSFLKRRLGRPPSSRAVGIDQIPESLFPLLAGQHALFLGAADIAAAAAIFFVGEILLSRLLFKVRLRDEPY